MRCRCGVQVSTATAGVLRALVALHGVVVINEAAGDLLEGGYANGGRRGGRVLPGGWWGLGGRRWLRFLRQCWLPRAAACLPLLALPEHPPAPLLPARPAARVAARQGAQLREQRRALVREVRPNAVALVDGFGYTDYLLNSALGRKDGNVYQVGRAGGVHVPTCPEPLLCQGRQLALAQQLGGPAAPGLLTWFS